MSVTRTEATTVTTCDNCGRSEKEAFAQSARLTVRRDLLDFQGAPVADGTIHRDLCDHCVSDVINAVNSALGDKQKSGIPHDSICYFKDGDKQCAVFGDFVNLQESPAGFGDNFDSALADLELEYKKYNTEVEDND